MQISSKDSGEIIGEIKFQGAETRESCNFK